MLSFWLLLSTGKSHLGLGQFVTDSEGLVTILFGLLLARIRLLVVMPGLEWLVLVVPQSLPSFSDWVGF